MISNKLMAKRQTQLKSLLAFANTRLEELRKEWEKNDLSEEWLAGLSVKDRKMLRDMRIKEV